MKPPPVGWPRLSSSIFYADASSMIDWLCGAFGFEVRLRIEGEHGRIEHSELAFGDAVVMVGDERTGPLMKWGTPFVSPKTAGGNTQCIMLFVDDVDAHCEHARKHGAKIVDEPSLHDYGEEYWADRSYGAVDPEGHLWWFTQRIRDPKP
jgi:uncharacterized glyoxalase superfamily protein PhnB